MNLFIIRRRRGNANTRAQSTAVGSCAHSLLSPPTMTMKSRCFSSFSNYIVLFTIFVPFKTSVAASSWKISYIDHCDSVVPQYPSTGTFVRSSKFLKVDYGHYSGGEKLFAPDPGSSPDFTDYLNSGYFSFRTKYIRKTKSHETFEVVGYLSFTGPSMRVKNSYRHGRYQVAFQSSFVRTMKNVNFYLSGFWSESTGMICMVGTGSSYTFEGNALHVPAVFKLYYPQMSNISTSIVSGTVESLDSVDGPNYFEKISVSAYAQKNYFYKDFPPSIKDSCSSLKVPKETRSFEMDSVNSYIRDLVGSVLKLEDESDCNGGNCYPFSLKNGSISSFLGLSQIYFSEDGKFHTRIGFFNYTHVVFKNQFEPEASLVGEGFWDHEKNQMCIFACQILANTSVGDCSIGISLWFPLFLTIKSRSHVMGSIWSNKNKNDPGYFSALSLRDLDSFRQAAPGMKYKYSLLDGIRQCDAINNNSHMGSRTYPSGSSKQDLSFSMLLAAKGGSSARAHAYLLSIGENIFADSFYEAPMEGLNVTIWNVSYEISYRFHNKSFSSSRSKIYAEVLYNSSISSSWSKIYAEGLYNSSNGHLCMVGCMYNGSSVLDKQAKIEDSMDCNILINVQFPPMDPKEGEHIEGTFRSTRQTSDPLYFETLSISSYNMYHKQASESIWRMDAEIIMVVISLTLSCVFIGSQLLYAKKHQEALPAISMTMLVVMTLGYFIPLILNFDALLTMIQNKQNSLLWSGEWMVVKEVIVRVLTLVAFVLQLRMLQVAWSARLASEVKKDFSVAERKTMNLCFVLYLSGAVIGWFVHSKSRFLWWKWEDLFSYAGFILDGFLFPQIMFNLFQRSQEKALSLSFYVGMTVIRIFPHFYDIYRARRALPDFQSSYIYASPEVDFYSLSWNIIIPLAGILFATLVFMQQRFGGDSILPSRFRKHNGYVTMAELNL